MAPRPGRSPKTALLLLTLVGCGGFALWLAGGHKTPRVAGSAYVQAGEVAPPPVAVKRTALATDQTRTAAVEPRAAEPESRPTAPPPPAETIPAPSDTPSIFGFVKDGEGTPIFGTVVELEYCEGLHRIVAERTTVDGEGRYELFLDGPFHRRMLRHREELDDLRRHFVEELEPEELKRLSRRFVGPIDSSERAGVLGRSYRLRAVAPGFRSSTRDLPGELRGPWPKRFDLPLTPGATLQGQVLSAIGPVGGARVLFLRDDLELLQETETDSLGRYEIDFSGSGTFVVHARAAPWGTGTHVDLHLEDSTSIDLPALMLDGPGFVSGRVVDRAGNAVDGIALEIVPEAYAFPDRSIPLPEQVLAEFEGGLFHAETMTDDQGRFACGGLLESPVTYRFGRIAPELQPTRVDIPTSDGVVVVFSGVRMRITVVSDTFEPLEGATVSITEVDEDGRKKSTRRTRTAGGQAVLAVDGGQTYRVRAEVPGFVPDEVVARVDEFRSETLVELFVLAEDSPLAAFGRHGHRTPPRHSKQKDGRVALAVETQQGQPVTGYQVRMQLGRRIPKGFVAVTPGEGGTLTGLPRGTYTAILLPTRASFPLMEETRFSRTLGAVPRDPKPRVMQLETSARLEVGLPQPLEPGHGLWLKRVGPLALREFVPLELDAEAVRPGFDLVPGRYILELRSASGERLRSQAIELKDAAGIEVIDWR